MTKRIYPLDERVFDSLGNDAAYWLGYIYADGNCTQENKIRLACAWSDRELLIQFRDFIKSTGRPIKEVLTDRCHNASLEFRSWRIHNRIKRYELTRAKALRGRLHAELLQREIAPDFVRGFFDGDGCFYYGGLHKNWLFAEITGFKPALQDIKNILVMFGVIDDRKKIVKNGSIFRIRFAKDSTLRLIEFLYGNNPRYYLRRKFGIAESYLQRLNGMGAGNGSSNSL